MPTTDAQSVSALRGLRHHVPSVTCLENHSCIKVTGPHRKGSGGDTHRGPLKVTGPHWKGSGGDTGFPSTPKVFSQRPDALVYVQSLRVQTAIKWLSASSPRESTHTVCMGGVLCRKIQVENQMISLLVTRCTEEGEVCKRWGPNP